MMCLSGEVIYSVTSLMYFPVIWSGPAQSDLMLLICRSTSLKVTLLLVLLRTKSSGRTSGADFSGLVVGVCH